MIVAILTTLLFLSLVFISGCSHWESEPEVKPITDAEITEIIRVNREVQAIITSREGAYQAGYTRCLTHLIGEGWRMPVDQDIAGMGSE